MIIKRCGGIILSLPIVVGISGASGVLYGVETLKILKSLGKETHLIVSQAAEKNIALEEIRRMTEAPKKARTKQKLSRR